MEGKEVYVKRRVHVHVPAFVCEWCTCVRVHVCVFRFHTLLIPFLNCSSMLAPRLTDAEQFDVIKVTTDSILPLPVPVADPKKKDAVVRNVWSASVFAHIHLSAMLLKQIQN